MLVGDHFSGQVQRFRDGRLVSAFGLRGEGCGRLGAIGGVAVDAQGKAYVTIGAIVGGRLQSFAARTTVSGTTIVVKAPAKAAPAKAVSAMRRHGIVTAGIAVSATTKDGVVDRAGLTWSFS